MRTFIVIGACVVALASRAQGEAAAADGQVRQEPEKSVSLLWGREPLWSLHYAKAEGKPYFHPVRMSDGPCLTWLRPPDHPWHRSLWFSWKYINGLNYWEENKRGVSEGRTEVTELHCSDDLPVTITMELSYHPPDKPPVLTERRMITASRPVQDGSYHLDWAMAFTAQDEDVLLDRTKTEAEGGPSWGGYAGLSVRTTKAMSKYQTLDSEGRRDMAGHGKGARWLDFSGLVDGKPVGVALLDHPDNPRHPTPMYIIMRGHFGYCSPAFLFNEPYTLPAGRSLSLLYRVLIHPGRGGEERLEREWKTFSALAHPTKR